jgi:hypothetical protein
VSKQPPPLLSSLPLGSLSLLSHSALSLFSPRRSLSPLRRTPRTSTNARDPWIPSLQRLRPARQRRPAARRHLLPGTRPRRCQAPAIPRPASSLEPRPACLTHPRSRLPCVRPCPRRRPSPCPDALQPTHSSHAREAQAEDRARRPRPKPDAAPEPVPAPSPRPFVSSS